MIDMGVNQGELPIGQQHRTHRSIRMHAGALADDLINVSQMRGVGTKGATNHAVSFAKMNHQGANQGEAPSQFNLRILLGHALATGQPMISLPINPKPIVTFGIHHCKISSRSNPQAKPFDPRLIARIAPAVAKAAMASGVATRPIEDFDAYRSNLEQFVYKSGNFMRPIFAAARRAANKRVVYAEGEDERVLRAAQVVI
ncbi:MAG: hypothetical protein EBX64_07900, partial [Betaproteobacteria bacterium]|nr:hypothetical protein [Betaproteobacteria bacterium]